MKSAMAAIRSHAKAEFIKKESDRIVGSFAANPDVRHRATIKVVQRILINGPYLLHGRLWEVRSKSLGAGVYELSIEKKKVPGVIQDKCKRLQKEDET